MSLLDSAYQGIPVSYLSLQDNLQIIQTSRFQQLQEYIDFMYNFLNFN